MSQSQTSQSILLALVTGILTGLILNFFKDSSVTTLLIENGFDPIGTLFVKLLKLIMIPMVMVSLIAGIMRLNDARSIGSLSLLTISMYFFTTAIAIAIAIITAEFFHFTPLLYNPDLNLTLSIQEPPAVKAMFLDLVATNPFQALVEGKMLQIIIISIIFGLAIHRVGEEAKVLQKLIDATFSVMMTIVHGLTTIAPIAIFCLMAKTFATHGIETIWQLLTFIIAFLLGLMIHTTIIYGSLLKWGAQLPLLPTLKKLKTVLAFAFSTSSSSATLPLTLQTLEEDFGVKNKVASFTLPLGATINMDGTAMMQGIATVFLAATFGISLSPNDYLMVLVTATLASIGTAGVPGAGMIMLAMVLKQVGIPVEGIALIIGIDRLLDMARTTINVLGDAVVTLVVARVLGEIKDEKK